MWLLSFMNCINMIFQVTLCLTAVITNWAFMWFLFLVNYIFMFVYVTPSFRALHLSKMPVFTQISYFFIKFRLRVVCTVPFFMCLMINHKDMYILSNCNDHNSQNKYVKIFVFLFEHVNSTNDFFQLNLITV